MIHVDRERRDDSGKPIQPNSAWFDSARLAREEVEERADRLLEAGESTLAELAFKASRTLYAHDEVKKALEALFRGKCAYCESEVVAQSHLEVEHFRPKERVGDRPDHPGYYWLAYEWTNLYLSCKLCNGRYRDQPTREEPTYGVAKGKYDQFPVEDESARAMSHRQDIGREVPALLDPCRDQPEQYLTFGLDGKAVAIDGDPKARETIEILHLDRRRLRDARRERIAEVVGIVRGCLKKGQKELALEFREVFSRPSSVYSAACEAIWRNPLAFGLDVDLSDA